MRQPIAIKGTEGLVLVYAKCCRPIPGDYINGLIKPGAGLEVHEAHCPLLNLYRQNPDKYVSLAWEEKIKGDFFVDLFIDILNQRGSLAEVALAISHAHSNIENIIVNDHDGRYFGISVTVTTHDRTHLARILRRIRKIANVLRVFRKKSQIV